MEKMGEWEQRSLINELTQGRELARQLQAHLNLLPCDHSDAPAASSHLETREFLVQQIQASYEKALSMLNVNTSSTPAADQPLPLSSSVPAIRIMPESPPSLSGSPRSDQDSDRDFKEQADHYFTDASKKRKTLPRWTQLVQVTPGTALEGPLDDGFSWRKYGQKDILGAKFPRGYYRCTHRNVQGCLATKQVQRSDDDPTIFEITYRGRHTCTLANHPITSTSTSTTPPISQKQLAAAAAASSQLQGQYPLLHQPQLITQSQNQLLLNFQRGLKVITQDLDDINNNNNNNIPGPADHQTYPPPPPPSSSSSSSAPFPNINYPPPSNIKVEMHNYSNSTNYNTNVVFSPAATTITTTVVGNTTLISSPNNSPFMSPATSGTTNYFSISHSPGGFNRSTTADHDHELQTTSDTSHLITDIIQAAAAAATSTSASTSAATNSLGFPFGDADQLDPNFTFDDHGFF